MTTNKGGRPKLPTELKRNKVIKFSCTEAEYEFFKVHAKRAGYQQVARFLHDFTIAMIDSGKFEYREQTQVNSDLLRVLVGLANNTNQAMHLVHAVGEHNLPSFYKSLKEAQQVISDMAKIAQLGTKKECHISNEEADHGNS